MNLRYWLAKQNMTAKDLSKTTKVDYRAVLNIANGKVSKPNPKTLHRLANGLGIEVSELLKEV